MFTFSQFIPPEMLDKVNTNKWDELKQSLLAIILNQRLDVFNDEEAATGKWAPLKPSTIKNKKTGFKILQDKGILRNSFSAANGAGSEFKEEIVLENEVMLRTNVEYARIHNEGGTINHPGTSNGFGKGIEIPAHTIFIEARPFNEFNDEQTNEINEFIEGYLNEE